MYLFMKFVVVLAEISARVKNHPQSYSRHARLTVDGALPNMIVN